MCICLISDVASREDPKGNSQSSLKYSDEPTDIQPVTRVPPPRRDFGRLPPEPTTRENSLPRRGGEDRAPLIPSQRQTRPGDVSSSAALPEYPRQDVREYPISSRKRSGPAESDGFTYYVGYPPEHEQTIPYVEPHPLTHTFSPSYQRFAYNGMLKLHIAVFLLCA